MRHLIFFLFCQFIIASASAQGLPNAGLNDIISAVRTFNTGRPIEKLYLQTDKPSYSTGDTLRFKAYLFDRHYSNAALKSGLLYIEIANDSNKVARRSVAPVYAGLSFGDIVLNQSELPQGGFTLRAYTNWMLNFGESYIFQKHFYISSPTASSWLVNYKAAMVKQDGRDNLQLHLGLSRMDKAPMGLKPLQLRVMEGKSVLLRDNAETTVDGLLDVNFNIPDKAKRLTLALQDMSKGEESQLVKVPLLLNRPENADLQFMPEGGNLVRGLPAHIAFKAISEDGMGTAIAGIIYDTKSQEIARFSSSYNGIGAFDMVPQPGEAYTAKVMLPGNAYKTYPLPAVKSTGISLQAKNDFQTDSIEIIIAATNDIAANSYFLIAQARGVACYGASFRFINGRAKLTVAKSLFPSGIARFTVAGADRTALAERIVFIDHQDNLDIQVANSKAIYKQRDSVGLRIKVTDKDGKPVQGSFSLAVTDDSQVRADSTSSIVAHMLLASDLKGTIENPGHYLPACTAVIWEQLDQLLLAQGWVGYDWGEAFKPAKAFRYEAEKEFQIKGRATNVLNKPLAGTTVTLMSKKPFMAFDTVTDKEGRFAFSDMMPADTAIYFIQANNKKGKSFNVGIEMDEFKAPVFAMVNSTSIPWYVNTDVEILSPIVKQLALKKYEEQASGHVLKEVVVTAKKIIKGSKNLNGPGGSDIALNEKDLEKAGKMTLGDLLYKNIPGFVLKPSKAEFPRHYYYIDTRRAHLVIDGISVDQVKTSDISTEEYYKDFLNNYSAEDIKGIEVMLSGEHEIGYQVFIGPLANPFDHTWIEITTRGGKGPFFTRTPGTYMYKPIAFTLPKKFYSPKYKPGSKADMTDIRSTVFWEPNLVTNEKGEASLSFYTADNPGNYTITIEGADMRGNLGAKRSRVVVEK